MSRTVGQFWLETWQLLYWSLFLPTKLQQRMDGWSGDKFVTSAYEILFLEVNSRFVKQFFLLTVILSLPLASLIAVSGQGWNWLILLSAPLISYGLSFWFLPVGIGFCSPLLLAIVYWNHSSVSTTAFQSLSKILPPLPQVFTGISVSIIGIAILIFVFRVFNQQLLSYDLAVLWVGSGLSMSILIGSWIATHNWQFTLFITVLTGFCTFFSFDDFYAFGCEFGLVSGLASGVTFGLASGLASDMASVVAFGLEFGLASSLTISVATSVKSGVMFVVASVVTFVPTFVVAISMAFVMTSITTTSLPWFLLALALLAFGCAPFRQKWLGILLAAFFVALRWENLRLQALWAVPVSLIFYYRILPDYLLAYPIILASNQSVLKRFNLNLANLIKKIPPYTTELLWLPLPHHPQILAGTFLQNNTLGLATFQKMQAVSLPGFQITIKKALPIIVADQLAEVKATPELINSVTSAHLIIPLLIPAFYQSASEDIPATAKSGEPEINLLFPTFQDIAQNTTAALQSRSSALKERGLERLVDRVNYPALTLR